MGKVVIRNKRIDVAKFESKELSNIRFVNCNFRGRVEGLTIKNCKFHDCEFKVDVTNVNVIDSTIDTCFISYSILCNVRVIGSTLSLLEIDDCVIRSTDVTGEILTKLSINSSLLKDVEIGDVKCIDVEMYKCHIDDSIISIPLEHLHLHNCTVDDSQIDEEYPIGVMTFGSSRRPTLYFPNKDVVYCGCYKGTLQQFKGRICYTHSNEDSKIRIDYLKVVDFFSGFCKVKQEDTSLLTKIKKFFKFK